MRFIDKIIIHCSDTPDDRAVTVEEIDKWHKQRGWSGIGYHYVIERDGIVKRGRDIGKIGAHVKGHNTGSIGVCCVGRNDFSRNQKEALVQLIGFLSVTFPRAELYGHNELDSGKTCPNSQLMDIIRGLRSKSHA